MAWTWRWARRPTTKAGSTSPTPSARAGAREKGGPWRPPFRKATTCLDAGSERLLDLVLHVAIGLLHLAGDLVGHALGLGPSVAGRLAGSLFDRTLELLGQTGDLILVHHVARLLRV